PRRTPWSLVGRWAFGVERWVLHACSQSIGVGRLPRRSFAKAGSSFSASPWFLVGRWTLDCLLAKAFGVGRWTFSSLLRIAFFNHFTGAISPDGRIVATGS